MALGVGTGPAAVGAQVIVFLDQSGQLDLDDVEECVDLLLVVTALAYRWLLEGHIWTSAGVSGMGHLVIVRPEPASSAVRCG